MTSGTGQQGPGVVNGTMTKAHGSQGKAGLVSRPVRRAHAGVRVLLLIPALALALAAGCQPADRPAMAPLHPGTGDPKVADLSLFKVRIVRLIQRVRPDAPMEDIWRLLGTTSLSHDRRQLWEANDLRIGEGAQLAADRMNELLASTSDRTAAVNEVLMRENLDFRISVIGDRDALDLVWLEGSGALCGRHFDQARAEFRLVCRSDPRDVRAVQMALVPEVVYGPDVMQWVRTDTGFAQKVDRRSVSISDLAAEVRLESGRLLVIGGRSGSALSLGGALFHEARGPDTYMQTLIITADRVLPGEVPPGTPIPFLQPARAPAKPPAKGPPAKPPVAPSPAPPKTTEKPTGGPAPKAPEKPAR